MLRPSEARMLAQRECRARRGGVSRQSALEWDPPIGIQKGLYSYLERPGLQDLSLIEQVMMVPSYVRPVNAALAAGHDDVRGSERPINFSCSKRSEQAVCAETRRPL